MSPLYMLLVFLPSLCIAQFTPPNALESWLSDTHARRALLDKWGGPQASLASAYKSTLQSDTAGISSRCLQDVNFMLNANTLQTFSMLDSSAKIPEGFLARVWTHLGNWPQCVGIRDVESPQGSFNGRMCMLNIYPIYEGNATTTILENENNTMVNQPKEEDFTQYLSVLTFSFAECVPSSCSADDVKNLYKNIVDKFPSVMGIKLTTRVDDSDCTTQDRPTLDTTDWAAVGILIALLITAGASTLYDILIPASKQQPVLIAFSVVTNGRKLLSAPRNTGDLTLSCLHGLRFISMAWVVLGHRYSRSATIPVVNPTFVQGVISDWTRIGITNAMLSVDTFFVLSGLLVGYLFFKQIPSKRKLNIPLYYLHRYIRLTPVLAMMVLLSATLIFRVGWGPIWSNTIVESRDSCREHWWNTLLYIGNFFGSNCVQQSWYLMVDMQLHWLSPLALYLLTWKPRIGVSVLTTLCFASIVANFLYSYKADLAGSSATIVDSHERRKWLTDFYYPVYIRFAPYLEGILLGYYLASQRFNGQKPRKLGFVYSCLAWLIVAALLLVPLISGKNVVNYPGASRLSNAFYNSLHRPVWGLGILGVVYLCASGNANPVNSLLSWYGFHILGRFSYCVYLVHMSLQDIQTGIMTTPGYLTDYSIITRFCGDIMMSLFFGGILSIMCESPFIVLEKELIGRFYQKNSSSESGEGDKKEDITESRQENKDENYRK